MIIKPAKELLNKLINIHIADANVSDLTRLDENKKQFYILFNSKDLFSSNRENLIFDISPEVAFCYLASEIKNFSLAVKFNLMIIPPKAVINSSLNIVDNVIVRSLEYYEIRIDEILTRYDILIEKVIKNA